MKTLTKITLVDQASERLVALKHNTRGKDQEGCHRNTVLQLSSGPSWNTHAATLTRITDDVNELQENTRSLQSHRTVASPWQQDAIDRITALANDLATNMNSAIDHLNKNKTRPVFVRLGIFTGFRHLARRRTLID
jgi:hypothetical protein